MNSILTHGKAAVITAAMVLATIYVLRRVPVASGLVNKALNG